MFEAATYLNAMIVGDWGARFGVVRVEDVCEDGAEVYARDGCFYELNADGRAYRIDTWDDTVTLAGRWIYR